MGWHPVPPTKTGLRTVAFGNAGMVTYLILDDQRRVDVLQVFWAR